MSNPQHPAGWRVVIGELFDPGVTSWPDGRFEYRIFSGHHLLQLNLGDLSARDIAAFRAGAIHLGLFTRADVIFVLFKIAGIMDWSDQAYTIQLVEDEEDRTLPLHIPGTHQVLSIVLVESETGVVQGIRVVTWSKRASALIDRLLRQQLNSPFSRETHAALVAQVYSEYPTSKQLARAALLIERAGEPE
jgi:hypothetical protein